MPTENHRFRTPSPVQLHIGSRRGTVRVIASDTEETTVEVTGRHDGPLAVVGATDDGRRVAIQAPRHRRLGNAPRLDILVRVPTGSTLDLQNASANVTTEGPLATVGVRNASGTLSIEQATEDADVRTASGDVRLGAVGGRTRMMSASGDLSIATATGPCRVGTASGAVDVGWAHDDVTAKSASGAITVRDAVAGTISLLATSGDVTVGVRKGTLVWLDLSTVSGRTTTDLPMVDGPGDHPEGTLELRVQTVSGDITVAPSLSASAGGDDRRQPA